jgi:hypothetical protein
MPSPPATYRPYMRGVYIAYAVLTWCYAGVGITGYHAFGERYTYRASTRLPDPEIFIVTSGQLLKIASSVRFVNGYLIWLIV